MWGHTEAADKLLLLEELVHCQEKVRLRWLNLALLASCWPAALVCCYLNPKELLVPVTGSNLKLFWLVLFSS